ncbi:hypothetical protein [Undibacterium arcticum]
MTAMEKKSQWLVMAGQRPSSSAVVTSLAGLHLRLVGDLQSIVDLDPEILHHAFQLAEAQNWTTLPIDTGQVRIHILPKMAG